LIALRLGRRIDAAVKQRRKSAARETAANAPARRRFEQIRAEAFSNLDQAEEIYRSLHHHRGLGTVRIDRGFLWLDNGDIERAAVEANEAYALGAEKKDRILMARARILESMIAHAKCEEGISDHDDPAIHAQRAQDYSIEALTLAKQTENRRLLARAYICHATMLCLDPFHNAEAARSCCDRAGEFLQSGFHDQLWEEYQALRTRLLRTGSVDETLLKWSQGIVGEQTFEQMTDEFEDLIIPKVWEHEGRKVSRVAAKLSISPKKVRRILSRLGLKGE
jgi:hypothetical protein